MKRFTGTLALLAVLMSLGCHHATIVTGAKDGNVVDKPWASSFIAGLVPPATIETASLCPGGVAKVETSRSFLNSVVSILTLAIYTPMHIKVTCAGQAVSVGGEVEYLVPDADLVVNEGATPEETAEVFQEAVDLALTLDHPVYVKFTTAGQ